MTIALLRLVLLARAAVSLLFAWRLHDAAPPTLSALVRSFEPFAIVDGAVALASAPLVLAASWGAGVAAVVLADGLLSLGWGVVLGWWPGIPYFSVSAVVFSGLLSALSGLIGLFQLVLAPQLRRRSGSTFMGVALGVLGAAFVLLAVLDLYFDATPRASRELLVTQALLQGIAFVMIVLASRRRT
jgi:hypothetical protein